jgi:hypothetical protein
MEKPSSHFTQSRKARKEEITSVLQYNLRISKLIALGDHGVFA